MKSRLKTNQKNTLKHMNIAITIYIDVFTKS
jgi:hypothetical protein